MSRTKLSKNQLERDLVYAVQLLQVYETVIKRLLDVHKSDPDSPTYCNHCLSNYPCPTARIINQEEDANEPDTIAGLTADVLNAGSVHRVRQLHEPVANAVGGGFMCAGCSSEELYVSHPCATVKTLEWTP